MSVEEENKAIIRRIFEEVWNNGDLTGVDELMATDHVFHGPGGEESKGLEGLEPMVSMFRTAFPDLHVTIEDMFADGDRVATRMTERGTHKGDFMGIAPTGRQFTRTAIIIHRLAGGKEAEVWEGVDSLALCQQLGVSPPGG